MELAIEARGLAKSFGAVHAVAGVDLDVPRGSSFGLIGENGAGKTTFIKLLLALARPSAGEVTVLGGAPSTVKVRGQVGYLPERLELPPAYNPVAFLRSVGRLKRLKRADVERRIPELLETVGLDPSAWSRSVGKFSKGMKQRTGLAAALLGDPELLILDEPTDGIDPMGRAQIREVIRAANQRGATVFLNSHLLAETERVCDHVAVLSRGRLVLSGRIDELRKKDAYSVRFVEAEGLDEEAVKHGFVVDDEARQQGELGAFRLVSTDPDALSAALSGALGGGLKVLEVRPDLLDLETVLERAVIRGPQDGGGP
jgi:ABC-2 type transport system ATP-binding protein